MRKNFISCIIGLCLFFMHGTAQAVPSITVEPGASPAGYIPLHLFGVAPIAGMGDETIVNFNTPSFIYAGQTWTSVGVDSNGYLVVGGGDAADNNSNNTNFPNSARPNNVLAPFWTDLDPGSAAPGGEAGVFIITLTDGINTWIVVDWAKVPVFGTNTLQNFEVWLGINGVEDITFTYGDIITAGLNLTVGAEDITGTVGTARYFNGAGIAPVMGVDLRVSTTDLPVPPVPGVPEPSTLGLIGLGLLGLGAMTRRRRYS